MDSISPGNPRIERYLAAAVPRLERTDEKRRDDRWETLKRRVQLLSRVDGPLLHLAEGIFVARIDRIGDPARIVDELRKRGVLGQATLQAAAILERPPLLVTRDVLATAQRDLRALAAPPALALARERKRALARYAESVDEAWLEDRAARLTEIGATLAADALEPPRPRDRWFDGIVELAAAVHGFASAARLVEAKGRFTALGAERRRQVHTRIEALAAALDTGVPPEDGDLVPLAERLDRARDLPGRARRTRTLDVLRKAIAWPSAPAEAVARIALPLREASFADLVREAGRAIVQALPSARDPVLRDKALDMLAWYGLAFRIDDDGVPLLSTDEIASATGKQALAAEFLARDVTVAQALRLVDLPFKKWSLPRVAEWVEGGVDLDLLASACKQGLADTLARADNARAARAYAIWATKLVPEYKRLGITFELSPELFNHLPRNEDVAILAVCLMEQSRGAHAHANANLRNDKPHAGADPIAVLDATLGMFQKLPQKASGILQRLRGTSLGAGRRAFPELAAWLDDDALLDRFVHLARIAGAPVALTKTMREDFDHAEKAAVERAHLERLDSRSTRQEARLEVLRRHDRSLDAAPRGPTKRRLRERIDELLPTAYRRELDAVFTEILREAWGIVVPSMTPAWRDAVRFWLVVDDNRELLGDLLRRASKSPGQDVKQLFPKSRAWIDRVEGKLRLARWLGPRRTELTIGTKTFTLALEDDPLEVLRMGIPFDTCLSLESGCNAASTVMNAIDANKRVLYVRNADGKIVARKLLAITKELGLVGYNTYVAVSGAEERAIRAAVEAMCRTIGDEIGAPLLREGVPDQLHAGFWYDDGTVGWTDDVDVAAYCRTLGLGQPAKSFDALALAARRTKAIEEGDVDAVVASLTRWDDGPGNLESGRWAVEQLGVAEAVRRSAADEALVPAVLRTLAGRGEKSMIEGIRLAPRMTSSIAATSLSSLLTAFPRSAPLARALAEMTARAVRVVRHHDDHGVAHVSMNEIQDLLDGVAASFDVLDVIEPAWNVFVARVPGCASCRTYAWNDAINELRGVYRRAPDPDSVVKCLMSRHRGELAHRCALAIAGDAVLPEGVRALARFATLRPDLAEGAAMLKARLMQEEIRRVTPALAKRLPRVKPSEVQALGALLFTLDGIEHVLPDDDAWVVRDLDSWSPEPWEIAWLRRRPTKRLRDALRAIASRCNGLSGALEKLALLGDVAWIEAHTERVRADEITPREPTPAPAKAMKTSFECAQLAETVRDQMRAADRGAMPRAVEKAIFIDRRLVEVAFEMVGTGRGADSAIDEEKRTYAVALELVAKHRDAKAAWPKLFERLIARRDVTAMRRILEEKCPYVFTVEDLLALWQIEEVRPAVVTELMNGVSSSWCPRITAVERAAARSGLSADGLFEAHALRLVEQGPASTAAETESLDQLRTVIRIATTQATAERAAALYEELPDELAASIFVRAVRRLPLDRGAAIRAACEKLKLHGDRGAARREWIRATRSLKKKPASSIERE